jgi:hypothetical protein
MKIPPSKKRLAAVHESAHAVIANCLGFQVESISIIPNGRMRGACVYYRDTSREHLWRDLVVTLSGALAQWKFEKLSPPESMEGVMQWLERVSKIDADHFRNNLRAYCGCDLSQEKAFAEIYQWTEDILDLHANSVECLSDILKSHSNGTLEGDDLTQLLERLP